MKNLSFLLCLLILLPFYSPVSAQTRRVQALTSGWEFHRGEKEDSSTWERVSIPHDWAISGPFDRNNDLQKVAIIQNNEEIASVKTGRTGGLPYQGIGWYRYSLDVALKDDMVPGDKEFTLLFDGAMSLAKVFVNGHQACFWPYGYNSFSCSITPYLHSDGKDNLIEVRLENLSQSSRWYPGAGLYRNVYLIETNHIHIPVWGTQVLTTISPDYKSAEVKVITKIEGVSTLPDNAPEISLVTEIRDASGKWIAGSNIFKELKCEDSSSISGSRIILAEQTFTIADPQLWSPESPSLYKAVSQVIIRPSHSVGQRQMVAAKEIASDSYSTTFGIRNTEVRKGAGFFLNGEPRKFKGVCLHHDLGPLGTAVNKSALRHQLTMLKEMGADAIRTTHNMPCTELIELCDEMGFMAIVENFDEWDVPKCANGYHLYFNEWAEKDMVNMIHHFRNNPSVVMWSIGNEVPTQWKPEGYKVATFLRDICHREDPTRLVTCGMDQVDAVLSNGFAAIMDVPGFNYRTHKYLEAYDKLPQKVLLGSETASTVSSRGVYHFPVEIKADALHSDHQSSSYDVEYCSWSNIPEKDFALADDYSWTMGQFIWTGIDYLGEPSPYDTDAWPNHSSMYGAIDLACIPKDRYYLYRSIWNTTDNTLHVLPHWNWKGHEGENIPIFVYTSYPAAELFVNGKSYGVRTKSDSTILNRYRIIWDNVPYKKGKVVVKGLDKEGNVLQETSVKTAGKAHHIELSASRSELIAGGDDLVYITVKIVDKKGVLCPLDTSIVRFDVDNGILKAVGNGDPTCLDSFQGPQMHAFGGMLTAIIGTSTTSGPIEVKASAKGLKSSTIILQAQ